MTERISNAVDIFIDAVNNGTLAKGTCVACAVGNLVASGMNGLIYKNKSGYFECDVVNTSWSKLFCTTSQYGQEVYPDSLKFQDVINNINSTDFTWKELSEIEYAFETNTQIDFDDYHFYTKEEIREDQVKGLEAVIEVMMDFDDVKENIQEIFTNKLIPV